MNVGFVTEGSSAIGFGHISRCLSVYQALQEQGVNCKFIVHGDPSVQGFLKNYDYTIHNYLEDFRSLIKRLENDSFDYLIIDSYKLTASDYTRIHSNGSSLVFIDDSNRVNYPPGIIVNGTIYGGKLQYHLRAPHHSHLVGPQYCHIRQEFWDVPQKQIKGDIENFLITFGGDDFRNLTPKILQLLTDKYPDCQKCVIMGGAAANLEQVKESADHNTTIIKNASAQQMKESMMKADIAISAGGQTTYELARIGLPAVLVSVVNNQDLNIVSWDELGIFKNAGKYSDSHLLDNVEESIQSLSEQERRYEIGYKSREIIDGQGARRIAAFLTENGKSL